jgi:chemotaxis protein MotB
MERMLRRSGLFMLVAVFGLTLVLGGCQAEKKRADAAAAEAAELRERNAQLEQANRDTASRLAQAETAQNQGTTDDMPRHNNGGMLQRNKDTGLMTATLTGDVVFGSGSDVIKPEAKKTLDKLAGEIKSQYSGASIRVEGYTDSDPLVKTKAKWGTNEHLSQARADAVRKYLINHGIKSGAIEAMGYGPAKPKATKAESRRVEVIVLQ